MYSKREESLQANARVNGMLDKLRSQLNNLAVRDKEGELVGEVKDLNLDPDGQVNLVVSRLDSHNRDRIFLLSSKLIQKIECASDSLFVNLSSEEIEQVPQYEVPLSSVSAEDRRSPPPFDPESEVRSESEDIQKAPGDRPTPESASESEDLAAEEIRLLEERLVIDRSKKKVGEVIVRKEIETRMVEIPVRYEKLIVEQVGEERQQLAEIDLGQGEITGLERSEIAYADTQPTVRGEFDSAQTACKMLAEIARQPYQGCLKVRVEIVVEDSQIQKTYQDLCDLYANFPDHAS